MQPAPFLRERGYRNPAQSPNRKGGKAPAPQVPAPRPPSLWDDSAHRPLRRGASPHASPAAGSLVAHHPRRRVPSRAPRTGPAADFPSRVLPSGFPTLQVPIGGLPEKALPVDRKTRFASHPKGRDLTIRIQLAVSSGQLSCSSASRETRLAFRLVLSATPKNRAKRRRPPQNSKANPFAGKSSQQAKRFDRISRAHMREACAERHGSRVPSARARRFPLQPATQPDQAHGCWKTAPS